MNKELLDWINDIYNKYCESFKTDKPVILYDYGPITKELFLEKLKHLDWFAEKWGVSVNRFNLTLDDRNNLYKKQWEFGASELSNDRFDALNIPKELIVLTYNNKTIEVYE